MQASDKTGFVQGHIVLKRILLTLLLLASLWISGIGPVFLPAIPPPSKSPKPYMRAPFLLPPYAFMGNPFATAGLEEIQKPPSAAVIHLENPSFENSPVTITPTGWCDCGAEMATPPDVQPGEYGVATPPAHGVSYVSMVVREDSTWESICQRLPQALAIGASYRFSLKLARSDDFMGFVSKSEAVHPFASPTILQIWGGNLYCDRRELLYQSAPVTDTLWQEYKMLLTPRHNNYNFLILECRQVPQRKEPYNGNLLIDQCSEIRRVK